MKTIEEKAKAYDEFLRKAKELYNRDHHKSEDLEYIFGDDLKEKNERKKLIETLINMFTHYKIEKVGEFTNDQIVGWLKEQLEKLEKYEWSGKITSRKAKGKLSALLEELESRKKIDNRPIFRIGDTLKKKGKDYTFTVDRIQGGYYHCDRNNGAFFPIEEQYDWELLDDGKISPKFKVGDWIVKESTVYHIDKISGVYLTLSTLDGIALFYHISVLDNDEVHLWTMEDAKDGDILVCGENKSPFIFKGLLDQKHPDRPIAYCGIDANGKFIIPPSISWWTRFDIFPATKEQQEILSQKMEEAGYEWDKEKKEPKKIEQKPIDKAESEFKIGDWITFYGNKPLKILKIEPEQNGILDYLLLDSSGHDTYYNKKHVDKNARLWSIEDAKDGDILASHECYVIFKEIDGLNIRCYCTYHYVNNPSFHTDTLHNKDAFHPATKEECEILYQKAKEAGYWEKECKNNETENETTEEFIVGKWYLCVKDFFGKGVRFDKGTAYYCAKEGCLQNEYGCHIAIVKDLYDNFRLWTINDAKKGDILAIDWVEGNVKWQKIVLFISLVKDGVEGYGNTFKNNKLAFEEDVPYYSKTWTKHLYPATKEQRELFKEQRELLFAKIEELSQSKVTNKGWSEEDETICQETIDWFEQKCFPYASEEENPAKKSIQWLKSLKQRL